MSLNLNGNVTGIYLGSTKADAVYLGNVKVFESQQTEHIGTKDYKVVQIGNLLWMAEYLDEPTNGRLSGTIDGVSYSVYTHDQALSVVANLTSGWRLPSKTEYDDIFSSLDATQLLDYMDPSVGGNGSVGLNISSHERAKASSDGTVSLDDISLKTWTSTVKEGDNSRYYIFRIFDYDSSTREYSPTVSSKIIYHTVRLVKPVS